MAYMLLHYGVKGMKWGVRRTPEQLGHVKTPKTISTYSGHKATPKHSVPNTAMDHLADDGSVKVRTFYDQNGVKRKDIHTSNHGNSKTHNFGEHGEHVLIYEWNEDGSIKKKTARELTRREREENGDIL